MRTIKPPGKLYVGRHGRYDQYLRGYPGLSEPGKRDAQKMGEALKTQNISQIFCSTVNRAYQTAEIVSHIIKVPFESAIGITLGQYIEGKSLIPRYKEIINDFDLQEKFMNVVVLPLLLQGKNTLIISHDPQLNNIGNIVCWGIEPLSHGAWAKLEPDGWPKQKHIHALSPK